MTENSGQIGALRTSEVMARIAARFEEISARTGLRFEAAMEAATAKTEALTTGGDVSESAALAQPAEENVSASETQEMVRQVAGYYGLDPALALAVARAESNFNASAVSPAGAVGIMQLMPATAQGLGVEDSYNALQNIDGGVRYLLAQLQSFDGDVKKALAAYNWGPGSLSSNGITDLGSAAQYAQLPTETQNYIRRVMEYYAQYAE